MNRTLTLLVLAGLVTAGAMSCTRREEPAPAATAEEPALAERRGWFGEEALAKDVHWRENGLGFRILNAGTPPTPGLGAAVKLTYTGRLKDGTVFDREEKPLEFRIGRTIPGLSAGVQMLGTGGKAVFYIPPSLGYGSHKVMGIPPNSGLIFEVTLVAVEP